MKAKSTLLVDGVLAADVGDGWVAFEGGVLKTGASLVAHGLTIEAGDGPAITVDDDALAAAKNPFGTVPGVPRLRH